MNETVGKPHQLVIAALILGSLYAVYKLQPFVQTKVTDETVEVTKVDETSLKLNNVNEKEEKEDNKPSRLTINLNIDSPEQLLITESDRVKKGQVIANKQSIRNKLTKQLKLTKNNYQRLSNLKPTPPVEPKKIPEIASLPEPSYLEFEASITKAENEIKRIERQIELKQQEINRLQELSAALAIINHEQVKLQKLTEEKAIALNEYEYQKAKLETAKNQRKHQEYQVELSKNQRIERINFLKQEYNQKQSDYKKQLRDYSYRLKAIKDEINEIEYQLETTTNITSPYDGIIRRIKFLNQSPDGKISVEVSLLVR